MPDAVVPRRVVVMGSDGGAVGEEVAARRGRGERAAGFLGADEVLARAMGEEMLGGVDEVVRLPDPGSGPAG